MNAQLQSLIEADPHFQRSEALSRRRGSHPVLRRYYLGERVDFQIRGCRSVPHPPPEDMRAGKQMILTDAHTEGIPHMEFIGVSLGNVNRLALPPDDITEVPVGLVSQMMELVLGMQEELTSACTLRAFDDQRSRRPRR
ncbi:hypothetical protein JCGZ_06010 [Jatropha curcas]|uniref:Uncharacterized protein n=1 Tax=Jatropha curcas TaxID=180498 RepID=A0A067JK86_JATCU|nr:hypothetical protein JCGZ_06010 [Jatropha curcas]